MSSVLRTYRGYRNHVALKQMRESSRKAKKLATEKEFFTRQKNNILPRASLCLAVELVKIITHTRLYPLSAAAPKRLINERNGSKTQFSR